MSERYLGVREAAERVGCLPRELSDDIYSGRLDRDRCPLIAGRRVIPESYLPEIQALIQRRQQAREGREQLAVAE
jgi:hypothetical protein